MILNLLLSLNVLICVALIGVVLLQRSEGGALGSGGGPTGLITTRGAGDLLTRTTWVLFTIFLVLSLTLTLLGGRMHSEQSIIDRLKSQSINPDALPGSTPTPTPLAPAVPGGALPGLAPSALPTAPAAQTAPQAVPGAAPVPVRAPVLTAPTPTVRTAAPRAATAAPPTAAPAAAPPPPVITAPPPPPRAVAPPTVEVPKPAPANKPADTDAPVKTTTPP